MSAVRKANGRFTRKPVPRCTDDQVPTVEYGGVEWGPADTGSRSLGVGYQLAVELAAAREPEPDVEDDEDTDV